ncbi:N-glycosidase [Xenorhabdus budapestensis]|uniref:N-glycosidase YbiA n=2 Tax=Xenorhabdus budapestensis TaxID=290110 RepID=A0A2D0J4N0_XENBU|nr:N-glycosidase [Xenorhabdus budapestensis]
MERFLLQTGDKVLVEASPVDRIWGIGMAEDNSNICNPLTWDGLNLLGFALMTVREKLKK